ncbi:MAG: ribosome biogenesis factor YjgA, partial [Pseudomonadota bacterium]|nr:ribosome biogenesis factor YjgA [Pseudomonadota bacterium]
MNSKPSKTARKREFQALQALGEQLILLTDGQLDDIGLEQPLHDAVVAARSIKAHGALRRQKQLIGKLMRKVDAIPIRDAINALGVNDHLTKRIFHDAERWRSRLREGSDEDVTAFFDFLGHSSEAVRRAAYACRNATKDRDRKSTSRVLFREIHAEILAVAKRNVQNGA